MSHKKKNENRGNTWIGYYPRTTKTKREKEINIENKHKHSKTKYVEFGGIYG